MRTTIIVTVCVLWIILLANVTGMLNV